MLSTALLQEFGTDKLRRAWVATENNVYDMEAWSLIIRDAHNRNIEDSRSIFEKLVNTFPTTGKFWKMYIEQEVSVPGVNYVCALHTRAFLLHSIKC